MSLDVHRDRIGAGHRQAPFPGGADGRRVILKDLRKRHGAAADEAGGILPAEGGFGEAFAVCAVLAIGDFSEQRADGPFGDLDKLPGLIGAEQVYDGLVKLPAPGIVAGPVGDDFRLPRPGEGVAAIIIERMHVPVGMLPFQVPAFFSLLQQEIPGGEPRFAVARVRRHLQRVARDRRVALVGPHRQRRERHGPGRDALEPADRRHAHDIRGQALPFVAYPQEPEPVGPVFDPRGAPGAGNLHDVPDLQRVALDGLLG